MTALNRVNNRPEFLPPEVLYACNMVKRTWGDDVSVDAKGKTLRKFGRTTNADADVKTTLATFGSVGTPNVNETYSTTNDIDRLVSSSGSDSGKVIEVEGHTIDGSGNLTFVVQQVTLQGQTPAPLTTPLARCTRLFTADGTFASPSTNLVGDIYAYASSGVTVTAGVPQTNTAVKARIVAGKNQSNKGATSISSTDYYFITRIQAGIARQGAANVAADIELEFRRFRDAFRPFGLELELRRDGIQAILLTFDPVLIVRPNTDLRLVATANTNDTTITGYFAGFLGRIL